MGSEHRYQELLRPWGRERLGFGCLLSKKQSPASFGCAKITSQTSASSYSGVVIFEAQILTWSSIGFQAAVGSINLCYLCSNLRIACLPLEMKTQS